MIKILVIHITHKIRLQAGFLLGTLHCFRVLSHIVGYLYDPIWIWAWVKIGQHTNALFWGLKKVWLDLAAKVNLFYPCGTFWCDLFSILVVQICRVPPTDVSALHVANSSFVCRQHSLHATTSHYACVCSLAMWMGLNVAMWMTPLWSYALILDSSWNIDQYGPWNMTPATPGTQKTNKKTSTTEIGIRW